MLRIISTLQQRFVTLVTIVGLGLFSSLVFTQRVHADTGDGQIDYQALDSGLQQLTVALENTRAVIKRSRFDPPALVEQLDYDTDPAIEFVRDTIAYQPYPGVLRGVAGTLRAGSGNSLDQAILLANLLKTAGLDARIARGTLSDSDALRLLRSTRQARPADSLEYLQETLAANFGEQAAQAVTPVTLKDTRLAAESKTLVDTLKLSLQNAGVDLQANDVQASWLPFAKEYFWVQYRDGPSRPWQDTHPAFGAGAAPGDLEAEEFFQDTVPEKYQHLLTISAWVGQWVAGKIIDHQVMSPWTRPVANLDSVAISYRNAPNGMTLDNAANLDSAIEKTQMFIPMLNDATAPGAMAFDLQGRVIDPMAMGSSAGIFKTMGDKMGDATSGLMDRQDNQPAMALDSMWLEITFTAPGGAKTTQRRYLLPPLADHNTDKTELVWPLLTNYTYQVNAGGQPLDYLAERYLATGIDNQAWLRAMIGKFREPDKRMAKPGNDIPADFPLLAQYRFMDDDPFAQAGVISFRAGPSLVGLRRGYRDAETSFAGVDIVANRVEHVRVTDSGLQQVPTASLARGVWDTVLENVPQKALMADASASASAPMVLEKAAEQNIPVKVLKPGTTEALDGFGLDANASAFVQADLDRGYAVVLPARLPDGVAMAGWWRVDATSGETLGMTGDGHGQDVVEYLTEVVGIAFNMVQALQSLKDCDKQKNDVAKMCCLVEANINNVAGLGFGGMLGATVGTAGGALFDILNYATTSATGGQGLMPAAKLGCDKMQATEW